MQPLIALPLFILVQEPGGLVDAGQRRFVTGGVEQGLVVVARNDHVTAACRRTGGAQQQLSWSVAIIWRAFIASRWDLM